MEFNKNAAVDNNISAGIQPLVLNNVLLEKDKKSVNLLLKDVANDKESSIKMFLATDADEAWKKDKAQNFLSHLLVAFLPEAEIEIVFSKSEKLSELILNCVEALKGKTFPEAKWKICINAKGYLGLPLALNFVSTDLNPCDIVKKANDAFTAQEAILAQSNKKTAKPNDF